VRETFFLVDLLLGKTAIVVRMEGGFVEVFVFGVTTFAAAVVVKAGSYVEEISVGVGGGEVGAEDEEEGRECSQP